MQEEIIQGGCVLLARQTLESEIWFKPPEYLKIFIHIMAKVNHSGNKLFSRGSNFFNFSIDVIPGVTKNQIYEFIRWAKSANMITTQKTTRGVVIKVNNYERYQNLKNYQLQNGSQDSSDEITGKFVKPTLKEVTQYCIERSNNVNPEKFIDFYEGKGWMVGKSPMKNWKACVRTWEQKQSNTGGGLF